MAMILATFIGCTVLVLVIAFIKSRKVSKQSSDGYFLGGRSLTGGVIAASLLLTNLSATHFVGMTGDVYKTNMSTIGWEISSAVCLVIVALFMLPRYLKSGITTIPDFLEDRYDSGTKKLVSIIFILGYLFNMLPITLYAGAVTMNQIFDIPRLFGLSYEAGLWCMVIAIGLIGCIYALFGGLKVVATADAMNGILLLVGGLLVPVFGLLAIGDGSIVQGLVNMVNNAPEKLNTIGSETDFLPFSTTFTGLGLVVLYFWGTDQAIIQRALAAINLKEGQKGVIFAGALKIFTPVVLMAPGLIAFAYYGPSIGDSDVVYPKLVNDVLPVPLIGIFVASMFGAILSVFSGILNSTSTLFAINIYQPLRGKQLTERQVVAAGKRFGLAIALVSMTVAPFIMYAPHGLYTHLQTINGFTNVPILTVILMGYLNKWAPTFSAKISLVFFVGMYGVLTFVVKTPLHYLHISAILFAVCCAFMFICSKVSPRQHPFVLKNTHVVNLKPWKYRYEASTVLVAMMVCVYILLSKAGLAREGGATAMTAVWIVMAIAIVAALGVAAKKLLASREAEFYDLEESEKTVRIWNLQKQ
jgi:SSS family solute:Na+ symporter